MFINISFEAKTVLLGRLGADKSDYKLGLSCAKLRANLNLSVLVSLVLICLV